ncbi:MAG: transcription elongation factor GreA [Candidatus Margulisbacteria bacterium]|nr:transcription elongation factor GreA [Candidatus Margulisiibacteriota bacterium]MBU1617534.1 transcription elongation factor GreA [Candidatus Margulisiibacteriota bacterium]MBU1867160.1 transcription elongation factor GreA [Candidatus Margulisiibacteriota bacterium]
MGELITKENFEKLRQKLEELKKRRVKISKVIGEAREHGDLRENSAYHTAKDEQGLNEMRIRDLEAKLANATIVEKGQMPKGDGISLGSTVKVKALDNGSELEFTLVTEMESDPLENKISTDSPIGEAVFGCKVGDKVEVEVPRGLIKYQILEIS